MHLMVLLSNANLIKFSKFKKLESKMSLILLKSGLCVSYELNLLSSSVPYGILIRLKQLFCMVKLFKGF